MAANEYHFITHWRVKSTVKEVSEILRDPTQLPRWWPSVYLEVKELKPGDSDGIGKEVSLYTKGWLPYTLRWRLIAQGNEPPHSIRIGAEGDFDAANIQGKANTSATVFSGSVGTTLDCSARCAAASASW